MLVGDAGALVVGAGVAGSAVVVTGGASVATVVATIAGSSTELDGDDDAADEECAG